MPGIKRSVRHRATFPFWLVAIEGSFIVDCAKVLSMVVVKTLNAVYVEILYILDLRSEFS